MAPGTNATFETVAPTSPRASRAFATGNHWSSAKASVQFGQSLVHSESAVGEERGRSRIVRGDGGTFEALFESARDAVLEAIRMGRMTALQKRVCAESLLGTSSGGWFRGPWRKKLQRRWKRRQQSNVHYSLAQGANALRMRSKQ